MKLIIPVESIVQNKGGVILYDPYKNEIIKQYVHDKKWKRVGWRGGKLFGDILIATDWTDLHYFDVRKWEYQKSFLKRTFNDLHYVEIHDEKLYIVNTGLDSIEIFENPLTPKHIETKYVFDSNPKLFKKRSFDKKKEYNKMMKFKPHSCHPNCIAFDRKRIFVSCFAKQQRINSGEVIELNTGKRLTTSNYDCHDGIFYGHDFYLTRTRYSTILVFKDLWNNKIPTKPSKTIKLSGGKGWWRGMTIHDDILYVFASDGYQRKKKTARIKIVNLKNNKQQGHRLPVVDGVYWDTIYQPNIWEG